MEEEEIKFKIKDREGEQNMFRFTIFFPLQFYYHFSICLLDYLCDNKRVTHKMSCNHIHYQVNRVNCRFYDID